MARKKKPIPQLNHDRWLISYADFITLLFAFFVVMYSVSSVNEGKYRVLSDSLVSAFHEPTRSLAPIQVGSLVRAPGVMPQDFTSISQPLIKRPDTLKFMPIEDGTDPKVLQKAKEQLEYIAESVEAAMKPLIDEKLLTVRRNQYWIEIEIKSKILFPSGSATLNSDTLPVLRRLGEIMGRIPNSVQVEGYTDNVPIATDVFPTNWELSAARSARVVRLFEEVGVNPNRMASVGFGEYHPISSNATAEGRMANRRVVAVVLAQVENDIDDTVRSFRMMKSRIQNSSSANLGELDPADNESASPFEIPAEQE